MQKLYKYGAITLVVIAFVIGGWYAVSKQMSSTDTQDTGPTYTKKEPTNGLSTLRDMLTAGLSQTCTFSTVTDTSDSTGVVYMSGGKMRGDFETKIKVAASGTETSHMISDGTEMRMWQDGESQGFVIALTEQATSDGSAAHAPVGLDTQTNYACTSWTPDATKFVPPSDITFVSMADMMKGVMPEGMPPATPLEGTTQDALQNQTSGDIKAKQCALCAQVADQSAQAQCKAAFQCK